jgi:hypothetical protein
MKQQQLTLKFCLTFAVVGMALLGGQASAQVLLSSGPYTNNFDSLPQQTGSVNSSNVWANNVTLPGWYCNASNAAAPSIFGTASGSFSVCTNILAGSGGSTTAGFYSYGTNGVAPLSNRSLGSLMGNTFSASGSPAIAYGVRFTNDTGVALTNFTISYTGKQWRNNGNATLQTLAFAYRVDSSPITYTDPGSSSVWVSVPTLTFTSPYASTTSSALDGNIATNDVKFNGIVLSGFVVLPGQEIFLRWLDTNDSGNDHALAIDDLGVSFQTNLSAAATGPSITVNPTNITVVEGGAATFTVTAGGTAPLSYQWYSTNTDGSFTLISGATTPSFSLSLLSTNYTGTNYFVIITNTIGSATSSVAHLTVTSAVPIITTIAHLHTLHDANYALTDTTNLYQVTGIVTTIGNLVSGTTEVESFFVQDGTGGMDVFFRGGFPFPSTGDHVRITAPLLQFNGLLEAAPVNGNPAHKVEILDSGNPLPVPQYFDFTTLPTAQILEENIEGRYMVISNVFLGTTNAVANLVGGEVIFMTNSTSQVFKMTVANNPALGPVGYPLPGNYAKSIVGVMSQAQTSGTVLTNSYSIVLSDFSQIEFATPSVAPIPLTFTSSAGSFTLSWSDPSFSLQSSTNVAGPYSTISGAASPFTTNTTSNAQMFFRLIH